MNKPKRGEPEQLLRGFAHQYTDEELLRWRVVPPDQKLQWLEEHNAFIHEFASPKAKRYIEMFRKGEI